MLTRHQSQENLEVDSTIQPRGKGDPNKRSSQRHVNVPSVFRPRRFSVFLLFFFFLCVALYPHSCNSSVTSLMFCYHYHDERNIISFTKLLSKQKHYTLRPTQSSWWFPFWVVMQRFVRSPFKFYTGTEQSRTCRKICSNLVARRALARCHIGDLFRFRRVEVVHKFESGKR